MDKITSRGPPSPRRIDPSQLRNQNHTPTKQSNTNNPNTAQGGYTLASEGPCIREAFDAAVGKVTATVVRVKVYAGDADQSVLLKFPPGEPVLAGDVADAVARKVGLGNGPSRKMFSLWMVSKDLEIQIRPNLDIFEVKQKWPRWMVKYTHFPEAEDPDHPINDALLVFRRDATIPKSVDRKTTDDAVLRLLYGETKDNVISGRYPCSINDAITLAAIRMQIVYGDSDPRKHGPGFITGASLLKQMIPGPLMSRLPQEEWEALILKEHAKYRGKSSMIARMLYLQYVRQWSCYGSAWFPACKEVPPGGYFEFRTQKWLLGLNAEGMVVVDQNKYKIAFAQPWEDLEWTFSPDTFIVDYRHERQKMQLTVITPQAAMIDNLATRQAYLVDKAAQDLHDRRLAASKSQDLNQSLGSGLVAVGFATKAESMESNMNLSSPPTKFAPIALLSNSPPKTDIMQHANAYIEERKEFRQRSNSNNKGGPSHSANVVVPADVKLHVPQQQQQQPGKFSSPTTPLNQDQKQAQEMIDALFAHSLAHA
ncbi:hypothetical protein SmJEL517_g00035 [Synchytrium microbalum]|uniref:FERM domain-containing protein n=1 Tax=Synchytrium microbalum TaxID=1806994 RepID=A0A507CJ82_9FUNG|nr:uncharacterized protein SmJEL517_g00035 [Synchytrium microbalum]TPX38254.1 hypothetical protein SmJEL517_g00035 [Synchytrium microbalum]